MAVYFELLSPGSPSGDVEYASGKGPISATAHNG